METAIIQARLPQGMICEINALVDTGRYVNKSEVLREALRDLLLKKYIGIIKSKKDSVKEIKQIRKKLSKEKFNLEEINKLIN